MSETWKAVPGYSGRYEVSDLGRVRSLPNSRRHGIRILSPATSKSGHLTVSLWRDGSGKSHQVHILVLETFKGPRPGSSTIWHACHADGNPANNAIANLRWDTRASNEADKITHGTSNRGTSNRANVLSEGQVLEIKKRLASESESHATIAQDYGVTRETISAISTGRSWSWL